MNVSLAYLHAKCFGRSDEVNGKKNQADTDATDRQKKRRQRPAGRSGPRRAASIVAMSIFFMILVQGPGLYQARPDPESQRLVSSARLFAPYISLAALSTALRV